MSGIQRVTSLRKVQNAHELVTFVNKRLCTEQKVKTLQLNSLPFIYKMKQASEANALLQK